jgi:ribosomal protein S18 acetylase RimI-like enzyme
MQIRAFQITDQDDVIDLWSRCGLTVPWNDPRRDIARKLRVDPNLFLVGDLEGRVIASVMGGYEGHRGWVNYLAVHPEYQRKGYGQKLMIAVEARLSELGCPKVNMQIRSDNAAVIRFYESLGYTVDRVTSLGKRLEDDT